MLKRAALLLWLVPSAAFAGDWLVTIDMYGNKLYDQTAGPRVTSPKGIMAMGFGGSLEDALRAVTGNLTQWLAQVTASPSRRRPR